MREKLEQKPSFSPLARQVSQLEQAIYEKLVYSVGRQPERAGPRDWFMATALAVRDQIIDHWVETAERVRAKGSRHVYYLSIEYVIGRLLFDALYNLELVLPVRAALSNPNRPSSELLTRMTSRRSNKLSWLFRRSLGKYNWVVSMRPRGF